MASGQSAVTCALLAITQLGDEIVAANNLYGGTYQLFLTCPQTGPHGEIVDSRDPAAFPPGDTPKPARSTPRPSAIPTGRCRISRRLPSHRPRARLPLIVDNTVGIGLVRPSISARYYRQFRHQIHWRPWQPSLGGGSWIRQVQVEQRQVPRFHEPDPSYHASFTGTPLAICRAWATSPSFSSTVTLLRDMGAALSPLTPGNSC